MAGRPVGRVAAQPVIWPDGRVAGRGRWPDGRVAGRGRKWPGGRMWPGGRRAGRPCHWWPGGRTWPVAGCGQMAGRLILLARSLSRKQQKPTVRHCPGCMAKQVVGKSSDILSKHCPSFMKLYDRRAPCHKRLISAYFRQQPHYVIQRVHAPWIEVWFVSGLMFWAAVV